MRAYNRLFLFSVRVRPISDSNSQSSISAFESETDQYPLGSESKKIYNIGYGMSKSDPIRSVYTPIVNVKPCIMHAQFLSIIGSLVDHVLQELGSLCTCIS
jgi:hypothetical protein